MKPASADVASSLNIKIYCYFFYYSILWDILFLEFEILHKTEIVYSKRNCLK